MSRRTTTYSHREFVWVSPIRTGIPSSDSATCYGKKWDLRTTRAPENSEGLLSSWSAGKGNLTAPV